MGKKNKKDQQKQKERILPGDIAKKFGFYFESDELNKFALPMLANEYIYIKQNNLFGNIGDNVQSGVYSIELTEESFNYMKQALDEQEKGRVSQLEEIDNSSYRILRKKISDLENRLIECTNSDSYITHKDFDDMCDLFNAHPDQIRTNDLLLYCAFRAQTDLYTFTNENDVYTGRKNRYTDFKTGKEKIEYYDGKGDMLISTDNGKTFSRKAHEIFPEYIEPFNRKKMNSDAIKNMFYARTKLEEYLDKRRKKTFGIKFKQERSAKFTMENDEYTFQMLKDALKSKTVWQNIDFTQIAEWVKEGIVSIDEIKQAFENKLLRPRDIAIINELGIIPDIHKATQEISEVQNYQLFAKLLLFTAGKIKIEDIEAFVAENPNQQEYITQDMIEELSLGFNKFDVRYSLYSLCIHDVLSFEQLMNLIEKMKEDGKIKKEDEDFLRKGIHDFKVNQLTNLKEPESFQITKNSGIHISSSSGLTIDPKLRIEYFKDIGNVKSIIIDGSLLISDEENKNKRRSLDGYELLIFPEMNVAILEKFFEVTHKDGKVLYRRDKNNSLCPAIENATYVIPIELAAEYATNKNKRELRNSGYVKAVNHSKNWVRTIEKRIRQIAPEYAKFDTEKTKYWEEIIRANYNELTK